MELLKWFASLFCLRDEGSDPIEILVKSFPGAADNIKWGAARAGKLEFYQNVSPLYFTPKKKDPDLLFVIASKGHFAMLQALKHQGFDWKERLTPHVNKSTLSMAAQSGDWKTFEWIHKEEKLPLCCDIFDGVARGGNLKILQFVDGLNLSLSWKQNFCSIAAEHGHLALLQWAREHNYPWDTTTCSAAAGGGHLEVLQWLRSGDNKCPWDEQTCSTAAASGNLKLVKWAKENGCPWRWSDVLSSAVRNRAVEVFEWAWSTGGPSFCSRLKQAADGPKTTQFAEMLKKYPIFN